MSTLRQSSYHRKLASIYGGNPHLNSVTDPVLVTQQPGNHYKVEMAHSFQNNFPSLTQDEIQNAYREVIADIDDQKDRSLYHALENRYGKNYIPPEELKRIEDRLLQVSGKHSIVDMSSNLVLTQEICRKEKERVLRLEKELELKKMLDEQKKQQKHAQIFDASNTIKEDLILREQIGEHAVVSLQQNHEIMQLVEEVNTMKKIQEEVLGNMQDMQQRYEQARAIIYEGLTAMQ